MAKSTPSDGQPVEPALIYDAGERRTHEEHAAEAYDSAQRADALRQMADRFRETGHPAAGKQRSVAEATEWRAQWHATMAVYEALRAGVVTRTTA